MATEEFGRLDPLVVVLDRRQTLLFFRMGPAGLGWWVTPTGREARESAAEKIPPKEGLGFPGKGEMVR